MSSRPFKKFKNNYERACWRQYLKSLGRESEDEEESERYVVPDYPYVQRPTEVIVYEKLQDRKFTPIINTPDIQEVTPAWLRNREIRTLREYRLLETSSTDRDVFEFKNESTNKVAFRTKVSHNWLLSLEPKNGIVAPKETIKLTMIRKPLSNKKFDIELECVTPPRRWAELELMEVPNSVNEYDPRFFTYQNNADLQEAQKRLNYIIVFPVIVITDFIDMPDDHPTVLRNYNITTFA